MPDHSRSRSSAPYPGSPPMVALVLTVALLVVGVIWYAAHRADAPLLGPATPEQDGARLASKISDLDFGRVAVGTTDERRFVLFHEGSTSQPLTVFNAWLAEPDALHFSTDFDGPITLQPGESLILTVRFSPRAQGAWTAPLYVSHDGASSIEIFTLNGTSGAMTEEQRRRERAEATERRARPDFAKSTLDGIDNITPTSLQFGPDGRLYVAEMFGAIRVYTVERRGPNDYAVQQRETILSIRDIANHDDDGDPAPNIKNRLVTGLLVTGSATEPVIYVASSDPRIGGGHAHTNTNLDTNSGVISRLTREGDGWKRLDIVRGLSRSEENHHPNGMVLDESNNLLYVAAGGNTNLGSPSNNFVRLPEYALSAAILEIDLGAIGEQTYDLPTLDDDSRPGSNDRNDPFGGNDGKNQAKLVPGGPVRVHAPGFRNAYDLVLTDDHRMYTVDNGGNSGWGGAPSSGSNCSNALSEPGDTQFDKLHFIAEKGYYGGHPNPTRGNQGNTFNRDGQSPVSVSNPIECVFEGAGRSETADTFDASVNGLAEYRASNFDGKLQGSLLAVGFDNIVHRIELNSDGSSATKRSRLFSNVGGIPLDIVAQADWQTFPGTIWIADFQKKDIVVFEPRDYGGSQIAAADQSCSTNPAADNDGDGFSNADETSNGTDPCSSADVPADADGDGVSDLLDTDDDNDGLDDLEDPYALDPANGRGTAIPLDHDWENDSVSPGFLFNLGFSGLMSDGVTDWQKRFDNANMTIGGAAGVLTIDAVTAGDAIAGVNNQDYGFQFGIDVDGNTLPFVVHTRLVAPFSGASRTPYQSLGFYIGTGDQDNYIKLVANTNGPRGGIQLATEVAGRFEDVHNGAATVYDTESLDLFLRVDPRAGKVQAYHRARENGLDSDLIAIGAPVTLPREWLDADTALAVGLMATSIGAEPFTATWDFVRVGGTAAVDGAPVSEPRVTGVDDDGDGIANTDDPFPLDAANGRGTPIPVEHDWRSDGGQPASLQSLGFSGVMNDGQTDWQERFDPAKVSLDPTSGALTLAAVGPGDPAGGLNSQAQGLQFGIDVGIDTAPFVVQTRLLSPLDGASREPYQSLGLYIGTGDQDNYIKLVANTNGARGGLQLAAELEGAFEDLHNGAATVYDTESVDLVLRIDPGNSEVRAFYRSREGGVDGELTPVGPPAALPPAWLGSSNGLAVGIIATSIGTEPFTARWEFIRVGDAVVIEGSGTDDPAPAPDSTDEAGASKTSDGHLLIVEAEAAARNIAAGGHAWTPGNGAGAVGGASLRATPDSGTLRGDQQSSPALDFPVSFPSAGRWYVWVRGKGDTNADGEGGNDSVHVGLNGTLAGGAAIDRFPPGWSWSRSTRAGVVAHIDVPTSGRHTVNVWMREDGFELDRVLLSTDATYTPIGAGPSIVATSAPTPAAPASTPTTTPPATPPPTPDRGTDSPDAPDGAPSSDGIIASVEGILQIDALQTSQRLPGGEHEWTQRRDGALVALPDNGTLRPGREASPMLAFPVRFDRAGIWTVWVHGLADADTANEGKNDSVHVGLNGALDSAAAMHGFPPRWTWSRSRRAGGFATITVERPGAHTLNVWMREDGFAFDRLTLLGPGAAIEHPSSAADAGGASNSGSADAPPNTTSGSAETSSGARLVANARWTRRSSRDGSKVVARHEGGAVEYQGRFYVLGGRGQREVSIFDPTTEQWSRGARSPIELNHFQPVLWGDRIWAIGAMTGSYPREPSVPDVYIYTPATDRWSKGPSIPASRRRGSMGAAVRNDRIYLFGGNTQGHSGGAVAWLDEFDPSTGAWRELPDAPHARDHAPIGIIGDRLVAAAGRRSAAPNVFGNMLAEVDVFDFASNSWETTAPIPTRRAGTMVVTVGDELIVIGGESSEVSEAKDSVEAYNVNTRRWRKLDSLETGRHGGGAAVLQDAIHVASGNVKRGGGDESTSHESLRVQR